MTEFAAADALCASLQVLNHLQDCARDLRDLDRCYIPQDWLKAKGLSTDDIARPETSPALRAVSRRDEFARSGNPNALGLSGVELGNAATILQAQHAKGCPE